LTGTLAYLDPGSASAILQMLGGGLAAVAITGKLWWRRVLRLLRIRRDGPAAEATTKPNSR
jgi:hypothetical protein